MFLVALKADFWLCFHCQDRIVNRVDVVAADACNGLYVMSAAGPVEKVSIFMAGKADLVLFFGSGG